ncbi:hypothetical protein C0J52_25335 [Blattella germanica]|nr:hypothetical protein C0J52_25335 [Blattella germanica]
MKPELVGFIIILSSIKCETYTRDLDQWTWTFNVGKQEMLEKPAKWTPTPKSKHIVEYLLFCFVQLELLKYTFPSLMRADMDCSVFVAIIIFRKKVLDNCTEVDLVRTQPGPNPSSGFFHAAAMKV